MVKILLKAAVLLFIVLSIYFIVHPSACSNLLAGREPVSLDEAHRLGLQHTMAEPGPTLSPSAQPAGQPAADTPAAGATTEDGAYAPYPEQGVFDTNTMKEASASAPAFSQQEIDFAIASRYVELEREYLKENKPLGKDASREISYIVMDDFEMSPQEWESFLTRATASNLFNKVREEMQ